MPRSTRAGTGTSSRSGSLSRHSTRSHTSQPLSLAKVYSSHIDDQHGFHHEHDEYDQQYQWPAFGQERRVPSTSSTATAEEKEELESVQDTEEGLADVKPGQQTDVEKAARPPLQTRQSSKRKDPNIVTWEGPDDPENPKNWTRRRRWAATLIVSSFTFISPVSSSMVAPALGSMARDLHVTSEVETQLMLSIFVLAYAIGPLFFGPLSEMYGRVPLLQLGNLFYFVWNLACGFARSGPEMLAFRFLSGLGGSAPLAIGGGVLGDCWRPESRGRAISIYSLAPLLGPAVGPIAGGFITENTTWRWVFWATCVADICIQISGFFFLQETYGPKLLQKKTLRLRKDTGNESLRSEFDDHNVPIHRKLATSLSRPFILLFTQPIIIVLACYMGYLYGLCYLVLSTFPGLWTDVYHESIGIGGLNYISLAVGFFLGAQIAAPINDRTYRRLKKRNNNVGRPEFRIPVLVPSAFLTPVGLFWYGWSAQAKLHWIMPNIGAAIFASGIIVGFQSVQTYIVDAYTRYAASGIAAATVLRSLAGFGFPLFAPTMYSTLGYGWGNSVLGIIAIVLGLPGPLLLWRYGERLRQKSQFAAGGS